MQFSTKGPEQQGPKTGFGRKAAVIFAIILAAWGLAYGLVPAEQRSTMKLLFFWILSLAEGVVTLYGIYQIYLIRKRYKEIGGKQNPMDIMGEALIPLFGEGVLRDLVIGEMSITYYSLIALFKKPPLPEQKFFTYHKESQIKTIAIVFIIITMVETAGVHFLLSGWNEVLAWVLLILNLYGILFLIAFANSFRYRPHLLTGEELLIRWGFVSHAVVPLHNIESIAKAKTPDLMEKIPKDTYIAYTQLVDDPQLEIRLKQPIKMKGFFGGKKDISSIVLCVDDPKEFVHEVQAKLESDDSKREK